jgi:hypothetical protein
VQLDLVNGNTLWMDVVALEIVSVGIAFKQLPDGKDALIRYQFIECHMILDVKLDGFCQKYSMVAGGHMAEASPAVMTYASVVLNRLHEKCHSE